MFFRLPFNYPINMGIGFTMMNFFFFPEIKKCWAVELP